MLKALDKASGAEGELHKRDVEIRRLRERVKILETEGFRFDSELQARIAMLQHEKESAVVESRVLLEQLARRDQQVAQQGKETDKLQARVLHLADLQRKEQHHTEALKAEHSSRLQNLEEQLQQTHTIKVAEEEELRSYRERCRALGQEQEILRMQLQHAVERADSASSRAEILQVPIPVQWKYYAICTTIPNSNHVIWMSCSNSSEELQLKLNSSSEARAKVSEEVAIEMVEHLTRLTGHVKELETSVDQNVTYFPGLRKVPGDPNKMGRLSTQLTEESHYLNSRDCFEAPCQDSLASKQHSSFSSPKGRGVNRPYSGLIAEEISAFLPMNEIFLEKIKEWTFWKWRWAATAARAENLAQQLQSIVNCKTQVPGIEKDVQIPKSIIVQERSKDLKKTLDLVPTGKLRPFVHNRLGSLLVERKLIPLILSAWRMFTRMSILEKCVLSRSSSLEKMMSAFPWWIQRMGERRLVERFFYNWQLLTLRSIREKLNGNNPKKKLVRKGSSDQRVIEHHPAALSHYGEEELGAQSLDLKMISNTTNPELTTPRPRSVPRCSACETRTLGRRRVQQNAVSSKERDVKAGGHVTLTARALRALQQELNELHSLLSQETQKVHHQVPAKLHSTGKQRITGGESPGKTLISIWDVCNNLAQSLSGVRAQLSNVESQLNANVNSQKTQKTPPGNRSQFPSNRSKVTQSTHSTQIEADVPSTRDTINMAMEIRNRPSSAPRPHRGGRGQHPVGEKTSRNTAPALQSKELWRTPGTAAFSHRASPGHSYWSAAPDRQPHDVNKRRFLSPPRAREGREVLGLTVPLRGSNDTSKVGDIGQKAQNRASARGPDCNHTTVVQIMSQDNKVSEVSIHTTGGRPELSKHGDLPLRDSTFKDVCNRRINVEKDEPIISRPTSKQLTRSVVRRPVDRSFIINSLKRENCIGMDYAALLKSEIARLREGRLQIEDKGEVGLAPNKQGMQIEAANASCRRPSWRPYY